MPKEHFKSAEESIPHGDASVLFPVLDLDATVRQHRDAELAFEAVEGSDVIIVAPTSLASSYFLTQHDLTAIHIDTLPEGVESHLDDALDGSIEQFELIQIGKLTAESPNHSLSEFTDA
jgi:hypothetical protein